MTMEKATSSPSDGNCSEMVPEARPLMPTDLFQAALKGNSDILVRLLGLPPEEENHATEEESHIKVTLDEPNTNQIQENLESATAFGDTILHILVANKHNDLALKVFQQDASLLKARNKKLETPLHRAAKVGNVDIIESLIQLYRTTMEDAVEKTNIDGDTALHLAAKHGHSNTGGKLLKFNRTLVYKVNKKGLSPLQIAIVGNKYSLIEVILEFDFSLASVQFSNGMFPVHVAASMGNTRMILFLLENFPDFANLQDQNGQNFFHFAADENIETIFTEELITKGARMLEEKDYDGNTPLHIAARKENGFIMKSICESLTFDALEQNNEGQTAFDISEIQVINSTAEDFQTKFRKHVEFSGRKFTSEWFEWFLKGPAKAVNEWDRVQLVGLGSMLIATVSFAAAFTFPGGYDANIGAPILGRRFMFRAFLLANALAFVQSFLCVSVFVLTKTVEEKELDFGSYVFISASSCMMVAFGTGSYVMLAPVNMPIAIIILVLALVAGSPLGLFLYELVVVLYGDVMDSGTDPFILFFAVYALTFLFAFCLAFIK